MNIAHKQANSLEAKQFMISENHIFKV